MLTLKHVFTLFSIFVFVLIISATSKNTADFGAGYDNVSDLMGKNKVVAFVDEAAAYVTENGSEMALLEFNNSTGSFVRGELYIFVYDFNGTNIAHPIRPDLVGHDQRGLLDINGVAVVRNELSLARRGGGFMYLVFQNPVHDDREELKLTYVKKIDNSMWLGSGIYLSNITASFGQKERDDLVAFVKEALQFARANGRENALKVFNDPKGNFTKDGRYIFAYDYDGLTLALPNQPELIGTNRASARDPNGIDINQQASDAAMFGNGFFYYIYPDPSRNMTPSLKLGYAVNVDDNWYLGSGIYAKEAC